MRKNKNKGFSLVEILVAVAVLAVLAAVLVPSLHHFTVDSRAKADKAAVGNLQSTVNMALQNSKIYNMSRAYVDESDIDQLEIVYKVNDDNILVLDCIYYSVDDDSRVNIDTVNEKAAEFKTLIESYVNSKLEPIELSSEEYRTKDYTIIANFPDIQYKVETTLEIVDKE
jgi:prepilin-type N-terminal cleavage/methylation domain-containing protein